MGGWRILKAKEAVKQMKREGMMHMRNAGSIGDELGKLNELRKHV